ncbi:MurR/RpiR family transcriptional regulator [Pseudoflavonifractor sp. 524-17]|uniref:MurR/RpiR family transcriptional regulator n=1 Tax=Pseudoflavonifractor sp. 524-17 TaxID=2304577 RepID=UPI00137A0B89|nr:MurR/RpiR family transcriptional regulator [Pseudoflavonifractor sp. 524-17]NCE64863.1 MurR/RpiR family transcriptional regulator [Pseudoflavonifractor sp. 524-17]
MIRKQAAVSAEAAAFAIRGTARNRQREVEEMILNQMEKKYSELSPGQRKIADYITEHLNEAVYFNAKQMAQRAGVSESAVVRFAAFLGYQGYRDMQRDMQREAEAGKSIAELFMSAMEPESPEVSESKRVYNQTMRNINETVQGLPEHIYEQALDLICGARRIGVVGTRVAVAPALTLQILMNQLIPDCQLFLPGMDTTFDSIRWWGEGDLLIAFSFMKYKNFTYDLLSYGKERGCRIISICDGYRNSIAGISDLVIPVRSGSAFLSFVPTMHVIDTLLYKLSRREGIDSARSIEVTDDIIDRFINHP